VLLAVNAESGLIVSGELFQATEGVAQMWAEIPGHLLQLFERIGGCPQTIEICGDRMANLLRPSAKCCRSRWCGARNWRCSTGRGNR
jgi:hypothetical protein